MKQPPNIAIVGATGVVGRELLALIAERALPCADLRLFASARSAGASVDHAGSSLVIENLDDADFREIDLAFFCASGDVSRALAQQAVDTGCTVIDNSSAFRMAAGVPLVVPEVNGDVLDAVDGPALIANPNCSTIIALMAVAPIHRAVGIERMVVATYQAASGGGAAMMQQLLEQLERHTRGDAITLSEGERQLALNVFTHESALQPDGSNEEEAKLVRETHRILNDDSIRITATCVRVPVLRAHSEAINLTLRSPLSESDARALLADAPGVTIVDDREASRYPEPVHAQGRDDVLVGRVRGDASQPEGLGLNLWASGDQLRKGAALNAIQIAERLTSAKAAHGTATPAVGRPG